LPEKLRIQGIDARRRLADATGAIICPYATGGGSDVPARQLAARLQTLGGRASSSRIGPVAEPDVREWLSQADVEPLEGNAADLSRLIASELMRHAELARSAAIKAE
jgi:tripartite-type tricarboxylate transporter receptor subunit TctC